MTATFYSVEHLQRLIESALESWLPEEGQVFSLTMTPKARQDLLSILKTLRPEARATVWIVANKTSSAVFATEADAKQYLAHYQPSVSGGMHMTEVAVLKAAPLPQHDTEPK